LDPIRSDPGGTRADAAKPGAEPDAIPKFAGYVRAAAYQDGLC
jgi:hypothetical protein